MSHNIPIPLSGMGKRAKSNPGQIKAFDNRDDRLEIANLLKHLPPLKRLAFFRWACSQATLPGTFGLHPAVAQSTVDLARTARHCDRADEQLTIDCMMSLSHMAIDYELDLSRVLAELVRVVRAV